MRINLALRYIGVILLLNAAFMFIAAFISLLNNVDSGFGPLMLSAILTTILGIFPHIFVDRGSDINTKESFLIVVGAWILSCVVGMFPYLLWGGEFSLSTAWFESVSGFSTTGASALRDVEALPKGLLFWRTVTQWLGGVGVVMFSMLILPAMGRSKMALSSIEMSPMAKENFKFRTHKIARVLLIVYVGITLFELLSLIIAGMGWFEALNISLSTVATGGFSIKNDSLISNNNGAIEIIIAFFMLISGLHFGLIYATVTGKARNIFNTEVSRFYLSIVGVTTLIIAFNLWLSSGYYNFWTSLRHSFFQVASYISTTGLSTDDANMWPPLSIMILMFLSIMCACAGSTSGGIKADRIWIALKSVRADIFKQQHPDAIITVKVDNVVQDRTMIHNVMLFIFLYLVILFAGTVILTACGLDLITSFSGAIACMGNVGPGFGDVGPISNYASFSPFVKCVFSALMLFGRLEIFGLLQIFMLKWWR